MSRRIRCVGTRYTLDQSMAKRPGYGESGGEETVLYRTIQERHGVFYCNFPEEFVEEYVGYEQTKEIDLLSRRETAIPTGWSRWSLGDDGTQNQNDSQSPEELDETSNPTYAHGTGVIRFCSRPKPLPEAAELEMADHLFFGFTLGLAVRGKADRVTRMCQLDGQGPLQPQGTPNVNAERVLRGDGPTPPRRMPHTPSLVLSPAFSAKSFSSPSERSFGNMDHVEMMDIEGDDEQNTDEEEN